MKIMLSQSLFVCLLESVISMQIMGEGGAIEHTDTSFSDACRTRLRVYVCLLLLLLRLLKTENFWVCFLNGNRYDCTIFNNLLQIYILTGTPIHCITHF